MKCIVNPIHSSTKRRLKRTAKYTKDVKLRSRLLIILNLLDGNSPSTVARTLQVSRSTVYNVAKRFNQDGYEGLHDRRVDNGNPKLDDDFFQMLYQLVQAFPMAYGWERPTWTREMLVETMETLTGVRVSLSTMSMALWRIGARLGTPKPKVFCPWPKWKKARKLREIRKLLENLPEGEVAFYVDEVDIHLNPKIGLDWMVRGQQKEIPTPGTNEKRYLAGAQHAQTKELIWVSGESKNGRLFIELMWELVCRYPEAKKIHLILDNYSIHSTKQVELSLQSEEGRRLHLHFLPPYCPDDNKIERTWQDLHANVTRNHHCKTMNDLMNQVERYLKKRNQTSPAETQQAA